MQKNQSDIKRRRDDLIREIEKSNKPTTKVISDFARNHYLSEKTVWNDYSAAKSRHSKDCKDY